MKTSGNKSQASHTRVEYGLVLVPNTKTAVSLRRRMKDVEEGKNISGPFTPQEAPKHLDELIG